MPAVANLVHEISTSAGTGNFAVALDANNMGRQRFSTAFGTGVALNVFDYYIAHRTIQEWERGTGHMSDANTLVRDTVLENSLGTTALVNFSAGVKDVTNDVPAASQVAISNNPGVAGYLLQSAGAGISAIWAAFVQVGTALARSWRGKLQESKSLLDWIPEAEHAAILNYTSTTDLSPYLQAAIDDAEAGGFPLHAPAGNYQFSASLTINGNSVVICGDGDGASDGTQFQYTSTTGDIFIFSASQNMGLENCRITCTGRPTGGYAIVCNGGTFLPRFRRVRIDYCFNGILIDGSTETRISGVMMRYMFGARGIQFGGGATANFRCVIDDFNADNPYPVAYSTATTWATNTAFTAGQMILNNGNIYQCTTGGTSAGAGTGPSGLPSGTTPESAFSNAITDGTAQWKFVCANLVWIMQESNAYSLVINKAAAINGNVGFWMTDGLNTGSSYPVWAFVHDLECDHSFTANVILERGEGFYATGSWWGSCLSGNGVLLSGTYRGEVSVLGTRISHAWNHGVLLNAGPVDVIFQGCFIGDNSQGGSGLFHGIVTAASRFQIVGCRIGDLVGTGGNPQAWGVFVNAGPSSDYIITNNLCTGNVTGGITDGGTGSKVVANNLPL